MIDASAEGPRYLVRSDNGEAVHKPQALRRRSHVAALVRAGADVNARFRGPYEETLLHWAASSDDVEVLDALLDAGADIDAPGAMIRGGRRLRTPVPSRSGTPCADWSSGRPNHARGRASLGLLDRVERSVLAEPPSADDVDRAFWGACHGGRLDCAAYMLQLGAVLAWLPP